MLLTFIGIILLGNSHGYVENMLIGLIVVAIGIFLELKFEIKLFKKLTNKSGNLEEEAKKQEEKELADLKAQVEIERLKKELEELKQKNA